MADATVYINYSAAAARLASKQSAADVSVYIDPP
jgi:hypothetical protein